MARERAQAVLVLGSPIFFTERQRVAELAIRHGLPTMLDARDYVEAGGLMSYSPHYDDLFRRGAIYVDKILKGSKPADLPVEQATKFELVINLKTAKALRLTIPQRDKNWEYLSVTSPRQLCGRLGSAPARCRCNEAPNRALRPLSGDVRRQGDRFKGRRRS